MFQYDQAHHGRSKRVDGNTFHAMQTTRVTCEGGEPSPGVSCTAIVMTLVAFLFAIASAIVATAIYIANRDSDKESITVQLNGHVSSEFEASTNQLTESSTSGLNYSPPPSIPQLYI